MSLGSYKPSVSPPPPPAPDHVQGCGLAWPWPRELAWVTEGAPTSAHLQEPLGARKREAGPQRGSGDLTAPRLSLGPNPEAALWLNNQWVRLWEGGEP